MIILHGNIPHKQIRKQKQQYMVNATTIHGVRSWFSNFYWTSIFLVLSTGEERIKDWSYNYMLYKTVDQVIVQAQV